MKEPINFKIYLPNINNYLNSKGVIKQHMAEKVNCNKNNLHY